MGADKVSGQTLPIDKPDMMVFTVREPLGVVAAVIPWNSQMFLSATKIGPALAMGNTIVLKASEQASAPLLEFGKLAKIAGLPDGVINVVTGHGEPCGRALTSHPLIQKIAFTWRAWHSAPHCAEFGRRTWRQPVWNWGKSPFIVFDDANLQSAVKPLSRGYLALRVNRVWRALGSICSGRLPMISCAMKSVAQSIRLGPPEAGKRRWGRFARKIRLP